MREPPGSISTPLSSVPSPVFSPLVPPKGTVVAPVDPVPSPLVPSEAAPLPFPLVPPDERMAARLLKPPIYWCAPEASGSRYWIWAEISTCPWRCNRDWRGSLEDIGQRFSASPRSRETSARWGRSSLSGSKRRGRRRSGIVSATRCTSSRTSAVLSPPLSPQGDGADGRGDGGGWRPGDLVWKETCRAPDGLC